MLTQEARNILEQLTDFLAGAIGEEIILQGHNNTGSLLESVRLTINEVFSGIVIEASTLDYGTYLNTGRRAGTMPPVNAIKRWVEQRGIASQEKEVNSIAWAIATKIKQEGIPTRGAMKFSKNGRRTNWIEAVLFDNEQIITDYIERAMGAQIEIVLTDITKQINRVINGN